MDLGGYVLAGLTALVGVALGLFHRVHDAVDELRCSVNDELKAAYRELGHTASRQAVVEEQLASCATRLGHLHSALLEDSMLLRSAERLAEKLIPTMTLLILITVGSLSVGRVCLNNASVLIQSTALLIVPFIIFLGEMLYLKALLSRYKLVRRAITKYKRAEY